MVKIVPNRRDRTIRSFFIQSHKAFMPFINRYSNENQAVLSINSLNSIGLAFKSLIMVSSNRYGLLRLLNLHSNSSRPFWGHPISLLSSTFLIAGHFGDLANHPRFRTHPSSRILPRSLCCSANFLT